MKDFCDKCHKECEIQEHHPWCKVLDNPHGYAWDNVPSRVWLCEECHRKIEKQVIIPILKIYSMSPQYSSENYLWHSIKEGDKMEVINKVVKESWEWLNANS